MLDDARHVEAGRELQADVCVVGTGAAGVTTALELERAGLDVLLLEAGGRRMDDDAHDASRGYVADDGGHDPLELIRQRRLGGTTTQWGGRCSPLDELDFARRSWVPHSGWPIGLDDILPYYRRAHHYLRLGEWAYLSREALPDSRPFLAGESDAVLDDSRVWRFSPPVNFWREYGRRLRQSRMVRVLHHATVVELERSTSGGVERARVATARNRQISVKARAYVLAVGGLESARLLLASNGESPAGIGNEHDLVGRFYVTHPVAEIGELLTVDQRRVAAGDFQRTTEGVYCRRMLKLKPEVQRELEVPSLAAAPTYPDPFDPGHGDALLSSYALVQNVMARREVNWKSAGVQRRYGAEIERGAHLRNVARGAPRIAGYGAMWVRRRWLARRTLPAFMVRPAGGRGRVRFDAEQTPEPANRVTLSRDRDRAGMPRLNVRHGVSTADREGIARSLRRMAEAINAAGAARLTIPGEQEAFDALHLGDGTHQMGLTRMADSPSRGVVDPRCRVHGCESLYIASGAVFPTGGSVGPTLTVVALAIRVADDIARELRRVVSVSAPPATQPLES